MNHQQGIPTPTELGGPLRRWQDPALPRQGSVQGFSFNTGSSRNWGTTPEYVNTDKHRWHYKPAKKGEKSKSTLTGAIRNWRGRNPHPSSPITPTPTSGTSPGATPMPTASGSSPSANGTTPDFMDLVRSAPDEGGPTSSVQWRDDPAITPLSSPRPTSTGLDQGEENLRDWLSAPPTSRTQRRSSRNTPTI